MERDSPSIPYSMFGLDVVSDFILPLPHAASARPDPDVRFIRGEPGCSLRSPVGTPARQYHCECPEHDGAVVLQIYRDAGHTWIWRDSIGTCHIDPSGRTVRFFPDAGVVEDQHLLGLFLAGLVSTFVLHHRGLVCLHASSIVSDGSAIVFLGPKGQGKSTMAAGFLRRGATLLTDDILPLSLSNGDVYGLPGLPIMKLWSQSVESALRVEDELPSIHERLDKKLFTLDERFAFADCPSRLQAIYILNRFDAELRGESTITIQHLSQREGLMALIAQASLKPYVSASDVATLMPELSAVVSRIPVRVMSYPTGFAYQDAVQELLLSDAERAS